MCCLIVEFMNSVIVNETPNDNAFLPVIFLGSENLRAVPIQIHDTLLSDQSENQGPADIPGLLWDPK